MLKSLFVITLVLGVSVTPLAWAQDDPESVGDEMQQSDESADDTGEAEFADDSQFEQSLDEDSASDEAADWPDEDSSADAAFEPEAEQGLVEDLGDAQDAEDDFSDITGDEEIADDTAADALSSDDAALAEDAGGADAETSNPVSDTRPTTPAPVAPPQVVAAPTPEPAKPAPAPVPVTPAPATPAPPTSAPSVAAANSVCGDMSARAAKTAAPATAPAIKNLVGPYGDVPPTVIGTVKFFNYDKGFGFIIDDSSKEEIFVNISGLMDCVREGDSVMYYPEQGRKGKTAVSVRVR